MLLLSIAMFISGYLTAVCMLNPDSLNSSEDDVNYGQKLEGITTQVKDVVKERGAAAYAEISEFLSSLKDDDQGQEDSGN